MQSGLAKKYKRTTAQQKQSLPKKAVKRKVTKKRAPKRKRPSAATINNLFGKKSKKRKIPILRNITFK